MITTDIKGKKFGRWKVISYKEIRGTHAYWLCKCSCGELRTIRGNHLRSGKAVSCGCYAREQSSIRLKKYTTSEAYKGTGNPAWKGTQASVSSVHQWLVRHFTKGTCEHCGTSEKKRDWALIKGKKYEHNRNNFMPLCRSCHLKYDYTDERRKKANAILNKYCPKRNKLI